MHERVHVPTLITDVIRGKGCQGYSPHLSRDQTTLSFMQVLSLGSKIGVQQHASELDLLEQRTGKGKGVVPSAVTYISDTEAGGLTFKGCIQLFKKLPFMHGLRELRLHGVGSASWNCELHDEALLQLSSGLSKMPSLQVRFRSCACPVLGNRPTNVFVCSILHPQNRRNT
jgi:hypothetical protein